MNLRTWLAAILAAWCCIVPAWPLSAVEFLEADELKPGDRGYGLTVFKGRGIERFEAEILGVMRGAFMGGDMILARLAGGPLEKSGVIAGMSGSPVYVDGKLIGAVAYGWRFAKEPICGLTPIGEMLELKDRIPGDEEKQDDPPTGFGRLKSVPKEKETAMATAGLNAPAGGLWMIETPVIFSGFPQQVVDRAAVQLKRFGMVPMQSGDAVPSTLSGGVAGGSEDPSDDEQFQPGAPLGAALVTGDRKITGVGTLTYRDGDMVLGFGHPMFGFGPVDLPMTYASIITCLPSVSSSFKIAAPGPVIGRIVQDRRPAILGMVGEEPDMLPFRMELRFDPDETKVFRVKTARNKLITPLLTEWVLDSALVEAGREMGPMTIFSQLVMECPGREPLEFEFAGAAESYPAFMSMFIQEPFEVLWTNSLEKIRIDSLSVSVRVMEENRAARLEEMHLDRKRARPGDDVNLAVVLKPYRGDRVVERCTITIPRTAKPGPVELTVSDVQTALENRRSRSPKIFEPQTIDGIIKLLNMKISQRHAVVSLAVETRGVVLEGREMPDLPGSMRTVMSSLSGDGIVSPLVEHASWEVVTDYVVEGTLTAELEIVAEEGDF